MKSITINDMILSATSQTASEGIFDVSDATSNCAMTGRVEVKNGRSVVKVEDAHTSVDIKITAAQRKEIEAWIESQKEPAEDLVSKILEQTTEQPTEELAEEPQSVDLQQLMIAAAGKAIADIAKGKLYEPGCNINEVIDATIAALKAIRSTKDTPRNGKTCREQILESLSNGPKTVSELSKETGRYYSQVLSVINALIGSNQAIKDGKKIKLVVDEV